MAEHSADHGTLESYWRIIWRRKWMIGLCVFVTVLLILVLSFLVTPVYEASATLHFKEPMPSLLGGDFLGAGVSAISGKEEINTQLEILRSRSMLEGVIARQGLIEGYAIDRSLSEQQRLQAALAKLRRDISVANITNTRLIRISARSENPELARDIANSMSQAFIERDMQSKRSEANAVLSFVSDQVELVSERLKNAEEELLKYKQGQGIGVIDEETKLKVGLLAELESSMQQVKVERAVLGTRITTLLAQLGPGSANDRSLAAATLDPAIARLQDQLTAAQEELTRLESAGSSSPQNVGDARRRIAYLEKQIQEEIALGARSSRSSSVDSTMRMQLAEYRSREVILAAQERALANLMSSHEQDINKLPAREINLIRLERARRINDELYAALMKAKNEAQIEAASQIGNIDIVDEAVTPLAPVRPNKRQSLLIGFLASLVLGIGLAFLLDRLDHTVRSEEEARKLLGTPILGLIPRIDSNGRKAAGRQAAGHGRRAKGASRERAVLITGAEPESPITEAFKVLRANLSFAELDRKLKTFIVTSPIPGDGKSTIAANLSIVFSRQGEKTLLVDADFRRPAIQKLFGLPDGGGLTDLLADPAGYPALVQRAWTDGAKSVDVLATGRIPPNATELLGSNRMRELIAKVKNDYDRIVFDVPPVLVATDAIDLASIVDGALVVLRLGEIDRRAMERMKQLLDNARIRVIGGVLNAVEARDHRYGYGYYYYRYRERKRVE